MTSETYTHGHHESVLRSHEWRTAQNSAGYLRDRLEPGATLLDIGCGPGTITVDLAELVAPAHAVGIDSSADVVATAEASARARGVENVTFTVGNAYALPFDDGAFDVVHAHQVLQHLGDPVAGLRQMRRVTRPGGLIAARDVDYQTMTWYPAEPMLEEWARLYQAVARSNNTEPNAGRALLAWAHAAGLGEVEASASTWCFATPAERAWWGGMWAERVTRSAFAQQALDRGLATPDQLERIAAAWRTWAASPDGWFGMLHGEICCRG